MNLARILERYIERVGEDLLRTRISSKSLIGFLVFHRIQYGF